MFSPARRSWPCGRRTNRRASPNGPLLAAIRPVLLAPRLDDPPQKVRFQDDHATLIAPGRALADASDNAIHLAFGLRNAGSGLAVLDRWRCVDGGNEEPLFDFSKYRRLTIDLYIPGGDVGYWLGAFRDPDEPDFARVRDTITARERLTIDLLYGDHEGGQQTISRFVLTPRDSGEWMTVAVRHWNVDRPNPR